MPSSLPHPFAKPDVGGMGGTPMLSVRGCALLRSVGGDGVKAGWSQLARGGRGTRTPAGERSEPANSFLRHFPTRGLKPSLIPGP